MRLRLLQTGQLKEFLASGVPGLPGQEGKWPAPFSLPTAREEQVFKGGAGVDKGGAGAGGQQEI